MGELISVNLRACWRVLGDNFFLSFLLSFFLLLYTRFTCLFFLPTYRMRLFFFFFFFCRGVGFVCVRVFHAGKPFTAISFYFERETLEQAYGLDGILLDMTL